MMYIEAETIGDAWIDACDAILNNGKQITDDGETLREIIHLSLSVKKPEEADPIIEEFGDKNMLEWMISNFFEKKVVPELKDSMSYGTRLFDYEGKDQIEWVVKKLKRKPESKSATISMLMPNEDGGYIPCVSTLDFKIRDGRLVLTVLCRSLDFGGKSYANLVALAKVQNLVAKGVSMPRGEMVLHVISAHVYEKDVEKTKGIVKGANSYERDG